MYNINKDYLYEVFDDYRESDEEVKIKVWKYICEAIWSTPNKRHIYLKKINFKVSPIIKEKEIKELFNKYNSIQYYTYTQKIQSNNSWFLLRQKINNIYTQMCDVRVCFNDKYYDNILIAKTLYFKYYNSEINWSAGQIEKEIIGCHKAAENLKEQLSKYKLDINWNEYKLLINNCIKKCLDNYIPLCEFEDKTSFKVETDCWTEDNYIIKYIGKSLDGYIRNYAKEADGVSRKCSRDKRKYKRCVKCDKLFLTSSSKKQLCNICSAYQPIKAKLVICVDCNKEFEVSGNIRNIKRCADCKKNNQLKMQRESMKKARNPM